MDHSFLGKSLASRSSSGAFSRAVALRFPRQYANISATESYHDHTANLGLRVSHTALHIRPDLAVQPHDLNTKLSLCHRGTYPRTPRLPRGDKQGLPLHDGTAARVSQVSGSKDDQAGQ